MKEQCTFCGQVFDGELYRWGDSPACGPCFMKKCEEVGLRIMTVGPDVLIFGEKVAAVVDAEDLERFIAEKILGR